MGFAEVVLQSVCGVDLGSGRSQSVRRQVERSEKGKARGDLGGFQPLAFPASVPLSVGAICSTTMRKVALVVALFVVYFTWRSCRGTTWGDRWGSPES